MSEVIFLQDVRVSFPNFAAPQVQQYTDEHGKPQTKQSYNAEFLMPETHPGFQKFYSVYSAMAQATWAENAAVVMNMIGADRKLRCFGKGEEKVNKKTFKPYDGYSGNVYLTAGSKNMPQIIRADGTPVDTANLMEAQALARKIYGGCRVNVALKPWIQKNKYGNGIRLDFIAIQFLRDDTAFGEGATDVTGIFGAVAQSAGVPGAPVFGAVPQQPMPAAPVFAQPAFAQQAPAQQHYAKPSSVTDTIENVRIINTLTQQPVYAQQVEMQQPAPMPWQ